MKYKLTYLLLLSFLLIHGLQAQDEPKTKAFMFGLGSSHYKGDLGSSYASGQILLTLGLKLNNQKRFNSNLILNISSLRGNELDYLFEGSTTVPATPNESFRTNYFSLHYEAQLNLIQRDRFKLYLAQGIGIIRYVPKDDDSNDLASQSNTRALGEDYRNISIMLPTQLGFIYTLNNDYGIGIQTGFLNTLTDYLDNISTWGNREGNDNVWTTKVQLTIPIRL
ncbi:hypothetical protein BFP72_01945 [Reichenbachiella sp. 5M10]|uniref:hypothetical protein n=1 Tax=Reichenbachiella sp. 5M10 TaxID=1889772 RepID=UPI000C14847A|nr:hypothetical protein [Reichenbachiella sp. 5M10]PIB34278.1 hypothetical protein BFP72_01945 [Reichenbachiella sp. 5M10]